MDSKNSKVIFVTKIMFLRTFVIITSHCNVICDNTKLKGQVTGIGQSSPGSLRIRPNPKLEMIVKLSRLSAGCYVPCKDPPGEEVAPEKTPVLAVLVQWQFIFLHN